MRVHNNVDTWLRVTWRIDNRREPGGELYGQCDIEPGQSFNIVIKPGEFAHVTAAPIDIEVEISRIEREQARVAEELAIAEARR